MPALVESSQLRDKLADDKGQLQAELERLKVAATIAAEAHQAELLRLKDAGVEAADTKVADLEKALQHRDRASTRERHSMFLEAQQLDETFASKCILCFYRVEKPASFPLVVDLSCSSFLVGHFPETHRVAEDTVRFQWSL